MKYLFILIMPLYFTNNVFGQTVELSEIPVSTMKITILYDNYVYLEGTESDWGFSCLIETGGQQILFDTGTRPDVLYKNIGIAGVDVSTLDQIFISHNHHDHIGGLTKILDEKTDIPVHLPYFKDKELSNWVAAKGSKPISDVKPYKVSDNVWSSGTMGDQIPEQCIVVNHEKGLIVVVGCSHPGISYMLEKIRKDFGKDIYAVLGGFHLRQHSDKQIDSIIEEFNSMGVKKCGCTHCTGDKQIQLFRESYGDDFIEMGTGRKVIF